MEAHIFLIGGSAGSIRVLMKVLPHIDPTVSFPIVIILHRKPDSTSNLDELLTTSSSIPVLEAEDKMELEAGKIYLAPADYHLLFESEGIISLDASEKVNYSRPSIDVTFESAARIFGNKVCALILSGANTDGIEGLKSITHHGGKIYIQNPDTAEVDFMPRKAMEALENAKILNPDQIASQINNFRKMNYEQDDSNIG